MPKRTEIVCIHEGKEGHSIDPIFINAFINAYHNTNWVRKTGSNLVRCIDCGDQLGVLNRFPIELRACMEAGANTTLVVFTDLDDDCENGDERKKEYWEKTDQTLRDVNSQKRKEWFDHAVFIFPKDRIENWIQFLLDGATDEHTEGPRLKKNPTGNNRVRVAARKLAKLCQRAERPPAEFPPSLLWSCKSWKTLVHRMQ